MPRSSKARFTVPADHTDLMLLVEDNPSDAELTLRALREHDLSTQVVVLTDGADALDFLFGTGSYAAEDEGSQRQRPSLVLLDLKLPKVDGFEVLDRVKGADETRAVPVVVLTSSEQDRDVSRSYALGCNSYVVKPVTFESFASTVAAVGRYWLQVNRPRA
jgi:two-component system, response regulator